MSQKHAVNFANFVCRFGENLVLLDLAAEVVIPAFLNGGQRKYGESRYIIQNTAIVNCGNQSTDLVIVGRFIRDTILSSEQKLENGEIVKSKASIPSAPSAIFALVLDTHKLLYLPETAHAPALSAFRATAANIIKIQHKVFINNLHEASKNTKDRKTRKKLLEEYPFPTIEVVPMASSQDFKHFLNQFKVLEQIKIEIIDTNNEIDGLDLVKSARNLKDNIKATGATISYKSGKGLSKSHSLDKFTTLAEDGNTKMTLSGKDSEGAKLSGDNEKFKMSVAIEPDTSDPKQIGKQLFDVFTHKVKSGLVKIQKPAADVTQKIGQLAAKFLPNG